MIQRTEISYRQGSIWVLVLIALAGCRESTPVAAPANVSAPAESTSSQSATDETSELAAKPGEEVAPTEMTSPIEPANSETPSAPDEKAKVTQQKPKATQPKPVAVSPSPNAVKKPKIALSVPDPPEYVFEPQVLMSQQDMETCLVKTGEPFPDAQLSDLAGQEHSLKELWGEKLTVVVFWANANRLGREQVQRLEAETVAPFENTGLNVVAINIGDPVEQVGDVLPADREVGFTILLDADRALFSKVATRRQPRTYLLDAKGNILWFDIEYSRSTVRELANAIHVHLGDHAVGDS